MNFIKGIIQHRSPRQRLFLCVSMLSLVVGAIASLSIRGFWILSIGSSIELINPDLHLLIYVAGFVLMVLGFSTNRANRIMVALLLMIFHVIKIFVSFAFSALFSGSVKKDEDDGYRVVENRTAQHIDEGLPPDYQIRNR